MLHGSFFAARKFSVVEKKMNWSFCFGILTHRHTHVDAVIGISVCVPLAFFLFFTIAAAAAAAYVRF